MTRIRVLRFLDRRFRVAVVLALLTLVVFGNTFQHDFSLDDAYVLENVPDASVVAAHRTLLDAVFSQSFDRVDYRPIPIYTFALQQKLTGDIHPGLSHVINVLLMFLCAWAFFGMIAGVFRDRPEARLIAFMAAVLFLLHPVHSNVVASLKNRDILLSFLFGVLAFSSFLRFVHDRKRLHLLLALLLAMPALLSKLDSVWVLLMMPLYYFLYGGKIRRPLVIRTALLFVAAYLFMLIRLKLAANNADSLVDLEPIIFTENPLVHHPGIAGRIFYAAVSVFYYVKFMIVPFGYFFYFGFNIIPEPHLLYPYFLLGLMLTGLYLYQLKRTYVSDKALCTLWLMWGASLFFFINLMRPVAGVVAPRLAFHASAPFCALLAAGVVKWVQLPLANQLFTTFKKGRFEDVFRRALAATAVIGLIWLPFTLARNMDWKDKLTLMDANYPNLRNSFQANRIASTNYLRAVEEVDLTVATDRHTGWVEKGLLTAQRAARIDPSSQFAQEGVGIAYMLLGDKEAAYRQFQFVINEFRHSLVAYDFTGDIFNERGDFPQAEEYYKQAIQEDPSIPYIYSKLKQVMLMQGKFGEARDFFIARTESDPEQYMPYQMVGQIYMAVADTLTGANYYTEAFQRGSDDAETFLLLSDFLERNGHTEALQKLRRSMYAR